MADAHIFGGDKGGTGKSFNCRTAAQYHLDYQIDFELFDTDRSNPDVMRIFKKHGCRIALFSEAERYENMANIIYNTALSRKVLVNLPAQVFVALREWFEKNELLAIAPSDGVKFYYWFVSDGGYDSLKLFEQSVNYFKKEVPHILVKNLGKCDDWSPLDKDPHLQDLIAQYQVKVIDFPKFIGNWERNQIDARSLTFGEALEYKDFDSISRQRVRRFLREAYSAFDSTGLFKQVNPQVSSTEVGVSG